MLRPMMVLGSLFSGPAFGQDAMRLTDDITIIGKVPTPEVIVMINREDLNKNYDLQLDESFLKRIVEALELAPF
jgi:hypothetical protein